VISYKLAAATNLLLSSTAFIYYGEEIGMSGGKGLGGDERLRTPMSWTANAPAAGFSTVEPFRALSANHAENNVVAGQADPSSLLNFYRSLIALKLANPALRSGSYEALPQEGWEMSFLRRTSNQTVLAVFNFARDAGKVSVTKLPPDTSFKRLWPAYAETIQSSTEGQMELIMPGGGFSVFEVEARP
jgi:glycosidase